MESSEEDEYEGNKDAARALLRVKQKLDGYEEGDLRSVHGQVTMHTSHMHQLGLEIKTVFVILLRCSKKELLHPKEQVIGSKSEKQLEVN